ncbi:MAG: serine/threonine-protein kinase [Vulcanimicrobiota bacterium]
MDAADETIFQSGEERQRASTLSEIQFQLVGYQLLRPLGHGSFGVVYAALQERTGQEVAIKLLRPEVVNWRYFKEELRQIVRLAEHPGVVSLLDADLEHQTPYYVMPLLRASLAGQTAQPDLVVEWLEQMAEALAYMHGKGVLHCDLKPSNVLLDERGHTRLVDFGQARTLGDEASSFGTLGYMAPEQAAGEAQPDVRWDVYGFGACAYKLLTGQYPRFSQDDRNSLSVTESASERLRLYRELISSRELVPLTSLNRKIDAELSHIVETCLELDPARRTPSMAQVVEDLQRRRYREPLLCRRPWSLRYRANRLFSRPTAAMAVTATLALPLFVNSYLTIRAYQAIVDLALKPVEQANEDGVELLRQAGPPYPDKLKRLSPRYHHMLLSRKGELLASQPPQSSSAVNLEELQEQSQRPHLAYYFRDGVHWMGAWREVDGEFRLLSETPAGPALERADDLRSKNVLLNLLILAVATGTIVALLRFSRS